MLIPILLLVVLVILIVVVNKAFLIISGYGAKVLCSGVFLCGRDADDIIKNELGSFPFSLGRYSVDVAGNLATGSVLGFAKKKAVYRQGLGATLLVDKTPEELKMQTINLSTPPFVDQMMIAWPNGDKLSTTTGKRVNQEQLHDALNKAFTNSNGTRAAIVLYDGEIVAERYAENFSADSKLAGWSMAKSITSALVGILVKQNKIDIYAPAPVDVWSNDARKNITLANLLQMNSGLRWWEYYAAPSDVTNMLYREKDMGKFAMQKSIKHEQGTRFNYASGITNIISSVIRKTVGDENYYRFPYEQLLYKIGMFSATLEADESGTFVGSSYCFATARDWTRFGLLYLNDGLWNGERILPEDWVKFTTTPTDAKCKADEARYGAQWWLNASKTGEPSGRKYPEVPDDCYYCQGYEGQFIWVVPSEKLVVVRLALDKRSGLDPNIFLRDLIKAFHI